VPESFHNDDPRHARARGLNSDSGCMITGGNSLRCSFGNMANGVTRKVHVTSPTTPANCGGVSNTANVSATNERTSDTGNNSSTASFVLDDATSPTFGRLWLRTKTLRVLTARSAPFFFDSLSFPACWYTWCGDRSGIPRSEFGAGCSGYGGPTIATSSLESASASTPV
jgi:hypothetical protein